MTEARALLVLPGLLVLVTVVVLFFTAPIWGGAIGGFLVTWRPLVGAVALAGAAWLAWRMAGESDWRAVPSFLFLPAAVVGLAAGLTIERNAPSAAPHGRPAGAVRPIGRRCRCGVPIAPAAHLWSRMGYCSRRCWERVSHEGGG